MSVHFRSGLLSPCATVAEPVTGHHARLGSRLPAQLYRGRHFRRHGLMRFQGATRTDPSEPNSGTRLLPRVSDGKAHTWPRMQDSWQGGGTRQPVSSFAATALVLFGCAGITADARERGRGIETRSAPGCWSARRGRRNIRRRFARAISQFRELAGAFAVATPP